VHVQVPFFDHGPRVKSHLLGACLLAMARASFSPIPVAKPRGGEKKPLKREYLVPPSLPLPLMKIVWSPFVTTAVM
jgi:hypothetical protein